MINIVTFVVNIADSPVEVKKAASPQNNLFTRQVGDKSDEGEELKAEDSA